MQSHAPYEPVSRVSLCGDITGKTFHTFLIALATPRGIEPRSTERQSVIIAIIPWSHMVSKVGFEPTTYGI